MSNITEWINRELYPALYDKIDAAFPELHFIRNSRGEWNSPRKLDGSEPKHPRRDKTVVTAKYAGLLEQGGDALSFIDYVKSRDGAEFISAVKTLAAVVGLSLPEREGYNAGEYAKRARSLSVLETANSYFLYQLGQPEAGEIRAYLESRGYSPEIIKDMGLGFIPSNSRLTDYLKKQGYSAEEITEALPISTDTRIGTSHRLTIAYRSGGAIKGFKFRTIGDHTPKYINSKGLDKSTGFFNLGYIQGSKDLVIVEGELDALHATAAGLENVVATAGSNLTEEAVKDAIARGAKRFTICFDREPGKDARSTRSAIDTILKLSSQVFIAELPDLGGDKTDPDRVIKEQGAEGLRRAIDEAAPYYLYTFQETLNKYDALQGEEGLTHKQQEDLIRELVSSGRLIKDPLHRARYNEALLACEPLRELGLTEEALPKVLKKIEDEQKQQEQQKAAEALLAKASKQIQGGDVKAGLQELREGLPAVSTIAKATDFEEYLKPVSLDNVITKLREKATGLKSGYKIGAEEITYPAGALTFIAAPTGHGKTTFLINAILKAVSDHPEREFHFFSYEESQEAIVRNTLNTFADMPLSINNRRTIESLLVTGSPDYISREHRDSLPQFREKQRELADLLESGRLRIHYTDYSSDDLTELITYLNANSQIGGIFIDYMQLLHKGNRGKNKYGSRQEELKQICIDLKDLAVKTALPIILGAQFNRVVVNPLLLHYSDIGEAGDIERIASLIIGLWDTSQPTKEGKESVKKASKGPEEDPLEELLKPGQMFMRVLKNRQGQTGGENSFKYDGNRGRIYQAEQKKRESLPGGLRFE
jgi:DNA primase catalytic core